MNEELAILVATYERTGYRDYEIRKMIDAWRNGNLNPGGQQALREELEEALGGGVNL